MGSGWCRTCYTLSFLRRCLPFAAAQELVLFLFGQPAQILCIPIEKYLVAGPECSLTRRGQPQMITAALLFPGHKAIFHQLDHAALAVAPVQVQVLVISAGVQPGCLPT